jgi:mannose-6-phosphate isomerase-like protein (cupin superfamily)
MRDTFNKSEHGSFQEWPAPPKELTSIQEAKAWFRTTFSGKYIVQNEGAEREILCEVQPTMAHETWSEAIVWADGKTASHYHVQAAETFYVLQGRLTLYIKGVAHELNQGEERVVRPGQEHWIDTGGALFCVRSTPGWKLSDHYLSK